MWVVEEALDLARLVYVDGLGGGGFGQAGHGDDLAREGHDKARARAQAHLAHGDGEVLRPSDELGVVGEGVLRLGHTHGQRPELVQLAQLRPDPGGKGDVLCAVDALGDEADLVFQRLLQRIGEGEGGGLLA